MDATKKLSIKKWEAILFSQIPEKLYKYLDDTNLTRATANNVAAWIMVKYSSYSDFRGQMRDALTWSSVHPIDIMSEYFADPLVRPSDNGYTEYKAEYDCAKKIHASQHPLIQC